MKKIIVYILTADPITYQVFNSRRYIVKYVTLDHRTNKILNDKDYNELERINEALRRCQEKYPHHYCIVMKDTSLACFNADEIYYILKETISIPNWDLSYLCRWLDDCQTNELMKECDHINILRTFSPHGIQCLMFSPDGRKKFLGLECMKNQSNESMTAESLDKQDYFTPVPMCLDIYLNKKIKNGSLVALAYSQNLFMFDPSKIKKDSDVLKLSLCRIKQRRSSNKVYPISFYITIVGLSALLLIMYHQMRP